MISIPKHGVLRPHGTILIQDPDLPNEIQIDCLSCCHCQKIWRVQPGSGKRRGFCTKCGSVTCGSLKCDPCNGSWEKVCEFLEAGKIIVP